MAPRGRTDDLAVCLDSDVIVAGLLSTRGASHVILILAEVGLFSVILPAQGVEEIRRNLLNLLPEAVEHFERFRGLPAVIEQAPSAAAIAAARPYASPNDLPILAAAAQANARFLVTHNIRHFREGAGPKILRPREFLAKIRAWLASLAP